MDARRRMAGSDFVPTPLSIAVVVVDDWRENRRSRWTSGISLLRGIYVVVPCYRNAGDAPRRADSRAAEERAGSDGCKQSADAGDLPMGTDTGRARGVRCVRHVSVSCRLSVALDRRRCICRISWAPKASLVTLARTFQSAVRLEQVARLPITMLEMLFQ